MLNGSSPGAIAFDPPSFIATAGVPVDLAVLDVNADGNADLALVHQPSTLSVLVGDGGGSFPAVSSLVLGGIPSDVAVGDLDGDGTADLLAGLGQGAQAFHGDGAARSSWARRSPWGARRRSPWPVDGDAATDAVAAGSAQVAVAHDDGGGAFGAAAAYTIGDGARALALADLDGDGDLDVVVAGGASGQLAILANASGALDPAPTIDTFRGAGGRRRRPPRRDDRRDLAVVEYGVNRVAVLLAE